MGENRSGPPRISPFSLMVILAALALSLLALVFSVSVFEENADAAWILLLMGVVGVAMSTYVLLQTRKRLAKMRIVIPPVMTTIECKKCGFKNVREFQRGDFVFKELEPCQKCNDKMLITAIYKEVKEKERQRFPF